MTRTFFNVGYLYVSIYINYMMLRLKQGPREIKWNPGQSQMSEPHPTQEAIQKYE
jgi:hypothetical protein